jgi:hypothetical protein
MTCTTVDAADHQAKSLDQQVFGYRDLANLGDEEVEVVVLEPIEQR